MHHLRENGMVGLTALKYNQIFFYRAKDFQYVQLEDWLTSRFDGSRTTHWSSVFLTSIAVTPADLATRPPSPGNTSTLLTRVPIGREPSGYESPSLARTAARELELTLHGSPLYDQSGIIYSI